tara:strand:+ start:625 stop:1077 length:453 start_codon:yes stop_codon:yes gene_type:complete
MEKKINILIASDHAGFELKKDLIKYNKNNKNNNINYIDFGCFSEKSVHYPDFAKRLCNKINNINKLGILICGTGIGMSITANRFSHIRAALIPPGKESITFTELTRKHNNTNILVLPGRFIELEYAIKCIDIFINTEFEGGRHQLRLDKI